MSRLWFLLAFVLLLGKLDQPEKGVRHTTAGRQDDALRTRRLRFDDLRDTAEALGVGDAGAAKLVDDPGSGSGH